MSLALEIRSPDGGATCRDCVKATDCRMRETLSLAVAEIIKLNQSEDVHPDHTGWGIVRAECHGFTRRQK